MVFLFKIKGLNIMRIITGKILLPAIFCVIFLSSIAFPQNETKENSKSNQSSVTKTKEDSKKVQSVVTTQQQTQREYLQQTVDYNIISSDTKGFEIEYFPTFDNSNKTINTLADVSKTGAPELAYRPFPLFLPSPDNNRLDIVEVRYEEINNVDIQPVPQIKKGKESVPEYDYIKDNNIYGQNKYYPEKSASLETGSMVRDKYLGNLKIYPAIYNPVTKSLKRIKYIRVRVNFGGSPILMKKPLSKEEKAFLTNLTFNWKEGMNWTVDTKDVKVLKAPYNSLLSSGDFYKIEVKETGMYIVDKAYLQSAGIDVSSINPATVRLFNYGGMPLPFSNAIPQPDDLNEVKIYVSTDASGKFDYLLFYGIGTKDWAYNSLSAKYALVNNIYSNSNYYWFTFNGAGGSRMSSVSSLNNPNAVVLSNFQDRIFNKAEVENPGSTGTLWVSQKIGYNESFIFNNTLTGYVQGTNISLRLKFGNSSGAFATFELKDDNSNLYKMYSLSGINPDYFTNFSPYEANEIYPLNSGSTSTIKLSLPASINSNTVQGNYELYEIHYRRALSSVQNNNMRIFAPDTNEYASGTTLEFNASTFSSSSVKIFDVTDYANVKLISPISYSGGNVRFQDYINGGTPRQYFVVGDNGYKAPASISAKIANQNLHGISDGASFIIISPTEFLPAANRLKAYREIEGPNKLNTMVVDINQIYNEFSNGMTDPLAVRNFLKFAYYNWNERPVYVLFFGDGSYDYKNIYNLSVKNWLPPVERPDDMGNEVASYPCDDFAANIFHSYVSIQSVAPNFSLGRLCVNSLSEANVCVDKIIEYESPSNNGLWKTHNMYVADDGWRPNGGNDGNEFTEESESIAQLYTAKFFEKQKIYIAAYPTVMTAAGRRKPQANIDIINGWNEGRLLIGYIGHGSTDLWAHEHIFVREESIPQLNNKGKYTFLTIASCDLARWDDPFNISAGEQLVFIPDKGAIGDIAASRPVYSGANANLDQILWNNLMYSKDSANAPVRFGKALYYTKAQIGHVSDNDAKYVLVGDPSLRIGIPQYFTKVDSINNTGSQDTAIVKALQKVRISGRVLTPDSLLWNNFNGTIKVKVFDVDKFISFYDYGYLFSFTLDGGLIYSGKASVSNGRWNFEFVVPKDISYQIGSGKIQLYFYDGKSEGAGYTNMFKLNGIDTTAIADTTGPQISLFMDSRTFRTGDIVNQNPKLIADIFDENGMNLTGTVGHKIEAVINDDVSKTIDLTSYYSSTQGYQYGSLEYLLQNLTDGKYNLKLKAWDTYNNYSMASIDFIVKNNSGLAVSEIYNYPNPFRDGTSFMFQHNFDSPISTYIKIYTVAGRMIKEIKVNNITEKNVTINWDGRDSDNDAIANGVYLYTVIIKTDDGQFSNNSVHKLVKLK